MLKAHSLKTQTFDIVNILHIEHLWERTLYLAKYE